MVKDCPRESNPNANFMLLLICQYHYIFSRKFPSALNFSNLRMSFFSLKSIDLVVFVVCYQL